MTLAEAKKERKRLQGVLRDSKASLEAVSHARKRALAMIQRLREGDPTAGEKELIQALQTDAKAFSTRASTIRARRKKQETALQRIRKAIARLRRRLKGGTLTMWDSIDPSQMPSGAALCYTGGFWPTCKVVSADSKRWHPVLPTSIRPGDPGRCDDVEAGDYTNAAAAASDHPVKYTSISNLAALWGALDKPEEFLFLTAHYDGEHICDTSCGFGVTKEMAKRIAGTQWTDHALGANLDQSLVERRLFD